MERVPITKEGHARLREELHQLKTVTRGALIEAIAAARAHGDLSENAEYHAAREKQSFVEGRIRQLETVLAQAEIIDTAKLSGKTIKFGARVTLLDEDTEDESIWTIVGDAEADASAGRIAIASPLARALVGRRQGDSVEVTTPRGTKAFEIREVAYE